MQCDDNGCAKTRQHDEILGKHEKKLFDDDHGVFTQLNEIRLCASKKVTWKSLVTILVTCITMFGASVLWVWAETRDAPERRATIKENVKEITALKEQVKAIKEWKKEDQELKQQLIELLKEINKKKEKEESEH